MEEIYKNLSLDDLPNEEWRDIEGYNGKYQVSSLGRVKSIRDRYGNPREKILKQGKRKDGYLAVTLCKDGKMKNFLVHRLVGNAFLENTNGYRCVNHKNEIKTDNRAENLEPCDHKYNNTYGTCIQRRVAHTDYKAFQARRVAHTDYKARTAKMDYQAIGKKNAEKLTNGVLSKKVYQYDKNGVLIKIWKSTRECDRNGFDHSAVASCCRGNRKSHRDFIWSYTEIN